MDGKLYNDIVDILKPFMSSRSRRRSLLNSAIFGSDTLDELDFGGNSTDFTSHLIDTFDDFGKMDELVLVLEALKEQVGTNKQQAIDSLITRLKQSDDTSTPAATALSRSTDDVTCILFLSANPGDQASLNIDQEIRKVDQMLRQTDYRDRFELKNHGAVTIGDLQGLLLRYRPTIVHFSGHGDMQSQLMLMGSDGNSERVDPDALANLFALFSDNVRCVVLNACYSYDQASAINSKIDSVIGMKRRVSDAAAHEFSGSFYQALGYGSDIQMAFSLGRNAIDLKQLDEEDTPQMHIRDGVDAKALKFV